MTMDCTAVRTHLVDLARGELASSERQEIDAHLRDCAACRHEAAADRALGDALATQMPRHAAPDALRRRLEQQYGGVRRQPLSRRRAFVMAAAAATAVGLVTAGAMQIVNVRRTRAVEIAELEREAVNDHLRVLYSEHPIEVQGGGIHQVRPWFEGRLDFAPVVGFAGNDDFPLTGGAVGYFRDRKAAVFVYKRRLHTITLFVFKDDGLALPNRAATTREGFHLVLWRAGGLGYALVSDLDMQELEQLARLIAKAT
jgi:anti-sigma factor RsiW